MSLDRDALARFGRRGAGFTLVEVMAAVLMTSLIVLSLSNVVTATLGVGVRASDRNSRVEEARFALERMVRTVEHSTVLFLPRPDDPRSPQDEADRDPGVLAMALPFDIDRNFDGVPDADNDGDGKFNEDPPGDLSDDGQPGIAGIDDDNDGQVDEIHTQTSGPDEDDDDEDDFANEDVWNGIDDDGDGWIDEDPKKDLSGEGVAGLPGVDENGDGIADNADKNDDDEDLFINEDWIDTAVYYLAGTKLMERIPVPWDVNGDLVVSGLDFVEMVLVERVSRFRVTRLVQPAGMAPLVELTLTLEVEKGDPIALTTRVRLRAGL